MTTTGIDPQIANLALEMIRAGKGLGAIADATGLLPNEIRWLIDQGAPNGPSVVRAPTFQPPKVTPPPVGQPQRQQPPAAASDTIISLLEQAEASDMAKVRTAAKRARTAIGNLHSVMAATEAERREKAAAKAKAAKEKAEAAERERVARATVDMLARQLEEARANLAAVTPKSKGKTGRKLNLTDEQREAARARGRIAAARTTEIKRQKRAEREAAAEVTP